MSDYTQDQFDQLPDFVKDNLEKVGDVYRDKGLIKVKQTADDLNSKLETERKERESLSERLSTFEKEQAEKLEEARRKALDEAKSKGDIEAIEKRHAEQMEDLEKRVSEKARNETLAEVKQERATEKAEALAQKIATQKAVDDDAASVLFELLQKRVTVDPETQKPVFLNDDGSASSLTESEFIAEVEKSARFKYLLKADVTTKGGGMLNGSKGKGSAETKKATDFRKLDRKAAADRVAKRFNL